MTARNSVSAIATAAAVAAAEWPKTVHAYRRQPHMVLDPRTGLSVEKPVEVVCFGERILFQSNEAGHIVAEVHNKDAYDRLVKEIPEAYIPYDGTGDNVPTEKILPAEHQRENVTRPEGQFVLEANGADGKPVFKVLDTMADDELRAFAKETGIEDAALPEVLKGETLQRAVYNLLGGA